jgi:cytochrome P450
LPPGTTVGSCAYLTFKDPALYPDPEQYRPERFLDAKVDPYAFAVFGGGLRRCLGMAFALNLLKGVIATVLSRTTLAIVSPYARPARHAFFVVLRRACRS